MKRAIIIVKGEVQRVGYRDAVAKIARKSNVTGFVENLKPYDVKIIAEGEKDAIDKFITQIRISKFPVFVEGIDVMFDEATGEFEDFMIRRGDWKEELGERMDVAGTFLYRSVELSEESVEIGRTMLGKQDMTLDKQDIMIDKQDKMLGKQDTHTQIMTEFRGQTQQNFTILDTKYGRIADTMEKLIEEMGREREETRKSMDKLTDAIIKLAESKR